jgi:hypothetical protein
MWWIGRPLNALNPSPVILKPNRAGIVGIDQKITRN